MRQYIDPKASHMDSTYEEATYFRGSVECQDEWEFARESNKKGSKVGGNDKNQWAYIEASKGPLLTR